MDTVKNTFVIDNEALKKGWGAEGQYWFSFFEYTIMEDIDLAQIIVPDDLDRDVFFDSHEIIPYFNVKRHELEKEFILSLNNKKLSEKFEKLHDKDIVEYFWKYYNVYPELFKGLEEFQNKFILEKAERWCKEHNIDYVVKL